MTPAKRGTLRLAAPVNVVPERPSKRYPEPGIALCLSGGGYRAMLFHVGALWRLNEAGLLPRLKHVSSVSGGSITAGILAMNWHRLGFATESGAASKLTECLVEPAREVARRTLDLAAILRGFLIPRLIGRVLAQLYDAHIFHGATLQDLPDAPRFVINATSLQTGVLWRFTKEFMADYRVGAVNRPAVPLAVAVAASSAFPPFLSPVYLDLTGYRVVRTRLADLHTEPYTTRAVLADGGVYDNLGLETAWKRYTDVLVSDGGKRIEAEVRPWSFGPVQLLRVTNLIDNQVRSLRKRLLIASYKIQDPKLGRRGAYWGIGTDIANYELEKTLPAPVARTAKLASLATRLGAVPERLQERLINWGYAVCDAAFRKHYDAALLVPSGFPYPDARV
jgi:NTE family protein